MHPRPGPNPYAFPEGSYPAALSETAWRIDAGVVMGGTCLTTGPTRVCPIEHAARSTALALNRRPAPPVPGGDQCRYSLGPRRSILRRGP